MENLIEYRKSLISKNKKVFFSDFSFVVNKNNHVALIGRSGCGKTALFKSLIGIFPATNLYVDGNIITNNMNDLYKNIAIVLNDTNFICDTVYKELAFSLQNLNFDDTTINERVLAIAHYFNFAEYLEYEPTLLNNEKKILLKILSFLIINPKVIGIDDLLIYLNKKEKEMIIKYINENNITLLLSTSDIEDTIFVDYIYILNEGKIIAEGLRDSIYAEEKLLNRIGYGLPFMVDLSTQLIYYNVLDKVYFSKNDMVDAIWK